MLEARPQGLGVADAIAASVVTVRQFRVVAATPNAFSSTLLLSFDRP